jgi:translation initiation factor IF-2
MSKRLVKVVKELNVGMASIVEFLHKNGFDIDRKPMANVTDEMYDLLVKEFQASKDIKEKAEQMILNTKSFQSRQSKPLFDLDKDEEEEEVVQEAPVKEVVKADKKKEFIKAHLDDSSKPKLKVLGKIDLDKDKKEKELEEELPVEEEVVEKAQKTKEKEIIQEEKPEDKKEEVAQEEKPKKVDKPKAKKPKKVIKEKEADKPEKVEDKEPVQEEKPEKDLDSVIRAKAPELKGLKVLGKIDTKKFERKPKKEVEKPKASKTPGKKTESPDPNSKRKRRRRKVQPKGFVSNRGGRRDPKKKDEVREISQKEIEEQIKLTMARLQGSGKDKRRRSRKEVREQKREKQEMAAAEKVSSIIQITEFISVSELAGLLEVPVTDVITTCMNLGVIVSINQRLDAEIIELVASEYEKEIEFISAEDDVLEIEEEEEDDPKDLEPRASIVTVMGHVDHGKTSLLDHIREAKVAEGEAGGITQHIGAYEVKVGKDNKRITFLDTPGHEAFTAMRARGAKITDVAVIIVAADDNIMPQTKEAISHAQAAGVPIVFAINKIDKPGADPGRIKQELASMNLMVEEWGGKYQSQDISAKTGENIDLLLEKILLEAELLDLKANPQRMAMGTVIEASLDKGRGHVAKMLVQNGTLQIGDILVAGEYSGRVKAMFNEWGKRIKSAGPSRAVLVLGLGGSPQAGETFKVMESEQEARQIATKRSQIHREQATRASKRISLDEIGRRLALGTFKELNLIVKGDVDGSIEALSDSFIKLSQETVLVNVIHKAVGQITESDVLLASASDAIIVGFQVRPSAGARNLAENEGVQIRLYSVIYEAIEEVKSAIEGLLEPTKEEKIVAQVQIREVYKISKIGTIAGCFVDEGKISRNSKIRIIRDGIVIYPSKAGAAAELGSLKRFKDDVKEVRSGIECGLTVKNFNDLKVGDIIEGFEVVETKQTID